MDISRISAALACTSRLSILQWLKAPAHHFPPQIHADIDAVGVCGTFFADKLDVVPATASAHLRILVDSGLITSTRIGKWTYFKRNDDALLAYSSALAEL